MGEDFILPTVLYVGKGEASTMYLSLEKRTIRLGLFCYKTENSIFHIVNIVVVSLRPLHTVQPTLLVPTTLSLLEMAKRVPVLPLGINLFQFLHCFNIRRKMLSFPPQGGAYTKCTQWGEIMSKRAGFSQDFCSIFIQFKNSDDATRWLMPLNFESAVSN